MAAEEAHRHVLFEQEEEWNAKNNQLADEWREKLQKRLNLAYLEHVN